MYTHNYSRLLFNLIHTKKVIHYACEFRTNFLHFLSFGNQRNRFSSIHPSENGNNAVSCCFPRDSCIVLYGARPLYSKNSRNNQIQPYFEQSYLIVKSKYVPFAPNIHTLYLLPAESFPFISTEDFSSQENRLLVTVTVFQPI